MMQTTSQPFFPKRKQTDDSSPLLKEKMGFWCPGDVDEGIQALIDNGTYSDRSKTIVGLLRKSFKASASFPDALQAKILKLSHLLERTPEAVVLQCVLGVLDMIDQGTDQPPVIVQEVALRKSRKAKQTA